MFAFKIEKENTYKNINNKNILGENIKSKRKQHTTHRQNKYYFKCGTICKLATKPFNSFVSNFQLNLQRLFIDTKIILKQQNVRMYVFCQALRSQKQLIDLTALY